MNKYTLDNFWYGMVVGVIFPPITAYIILLITFTNKLSFDLSGEMYSYVTDYIVSVFKLGCLSNLLAFLPCFYFKMNAASKGIMAATFLCFFSVLIYSFI